MTNQDIDTRMDALRQWITETEQEYQFAYARGDMTATGHHKKQLANLRNQFGSLLRKKMNGSHR